MSKNFLKWVLIVNIAILVLVAVRFIFFASSNREEWTPPPIIDNTDEILTETEEIAASQALIDSLEKVITLRDELVASKTESLIKLKKDYESKKNSVAVLPASESIKFFTEYISREQAGNNR